MILYQYYTLKVDQDYNINSLKEDLEKVFGFNQEEYLEIDLDSYFEASSLSNLIGASKGYVGYETGGILSEHIIKYPFSLIYFKNLNSAHFIIQAFIKKLFDKPYFNDSKGRKVYLTNTIIVYNEGKANSNQLGILDKKSK